MAYLRETHGISVAWLQEFVNQQWGEDTVLSHSLFARTALNRERGFDELPFYAAAIFSQEEWSTVKSAWKMQRLNDPQQENMVNPETRQITLPKATWAMIDEAERRCATQNLCTSISHSSKIWLGDQVVAEMLDMYG